jgi:hypothetical protein
MTAHILTLRRKTTEQQAIDIDKLGINLSYKIYPGTDFEMSQYAS